MENFKIYSHTHKLLRQKRKWPDKYNTLYGYPHSFKSCILHRGNILLFQRVPIVEYFLDQSDYLIYDTESSNYNCKADEGGITIQFCLEGKANFKMFDNKWCYVKKGLHNMNIFGSVSNKVQFKEQAHHKIFEISISKVKLLELSKRYSFLQPLLKGTEKGCALLLFEAPQCTTTAMYLLLSKIMYNLNKPVLNALFIKGLIEQLITEFFDNVSIQEPGALYDFEIVSRVYMAEVYMQEFYRTDGIDAARAAANLNANKFSKAFKHVFERSPKQYLLSIRMDNAKEILLSGSRLNSLSDLPKLVGYKRLKYFLSQYFKYHGVEAKEHYEEGQRL